MDGPWSCPACHLRTCLVVKSREVWDGFAVGDALAQAQAAETRRSVPQHFPGAGGLGMHTHAPCFTRLGRDPCYVGTHTFQKHDFTALGTAEMFSIVGISKLCH